jgi:hypothetical protein
VSGRLPEGDVFFFFSDAAGAKACLALAHTMRSERPTNTLRLFSNRRHDFESEWDLPVQHVEQLEIGHFQGADAIFTGTSHPDSSGGFELRAIAWAQRLGLPSFAFVDHWVNFRRRFELGSELILPDRVLVLDEQAVQLAQADGLPAGCLDILPNPYHAFLKDRWRPRRSRSDMRAALGLPSLASPVWLYAPDPISLRDADGKHGFDEISATRDLLACLHALPGTQPQLLVKLHPLQPENALGDMLADVAGVLVIPPASASVPELIHASDLVIGFYSNLLLEARALGRPVLRYFPGHKSFDLLAHAELGTPATTREDLLAALSAHQASGLHRLTP